MVQAMSLFNQLLQHFPSLEFAALVRKHSAERAAKGFSCWTQLVAMLFCQLAHADSLREICNGLACSLGKLVHLGIGVAPNKSTLAYANKHRPAKLYEELFYTALGRFRDEKGLGVRKQRFRFKNKLLSLDSTTISLCLEMFPWAKFRRAKGGVKAHVLLDHDDYLPRYVLITEARRSDVKMADAFPLNPGSIVVMDRGYNDYALFGKWTDEEIYFVTRLKDNAAYEVLEEWPGSGKPEYPVRPADSVHRRKGSKGLPLPAEARGGVGRRQRAGDRAADQPAGVWRHDHCRDLQRPLGNWRVQTRTHCPVGERPAEVKRLRPRSWGGTVARKQDGGALRQTYSKGVCATHQVATCSERRRSLVTRISGG